MMGTEFAVSKGKLLPPKPLQFFLSYLERPFFACPAQSASFFRPSASAFCGKLLALKVEETFPFVARNSL
jgi:hypothetical protein